MAHMIEGNKAFYTGKPAWHGLGTVLQDAPTYQEAWRMAYPHNLLEFPLATQEGAQPIDGWKAIIRDDGKVIACVKNSYTIMQPFEHMKWFEPYLNSGDVTLEAGGSLCEGTRIWVLGKLKAGTADIVKGDPVEAYLLAYTGFDGSLAYGTKLTPTRVVCHNTLSTALSHKAINNVQYTIRHTKSIKDRAIGIQTEIAIALERFRGLTDTYKALAAKKMTAEAMNTYVKRVFISEELEAKLKEENKDVSAKMVTKINRVLSLVEGQAGLELVPAVRGTAWQAYNAVTQYLTHEHGRAADSRVNGQWFGESARLNDRALELAVSA